MNIRKHLESQHVAYDMLDHPCTFRARQMAEVLDQCPDYVAKTVLLRTASDYVVAVLPASCTIDLKRAAHALNVEKVVIASEEEIARCFGDCELGIVPPFGSLYGLKTLVDHFLTADAEIYFAGNEHHMAYRVSFDDYRRIEHPIVARFAHLD